MNTKNTNRFSLLSLEDRLVPAFPIPANAALIAPDNGGIPVVQIVDPSSGGTVATIQAYEDAFRGGVHATLGDVNGDGVNDVIIGPGAGGGPRIRIINGKDGSTLRDFFVYESSFTGGVYVSTGDVNGDGKDDIITGTGNGGGPRVRVLDGATLGANTLQDFFAYESSFRGGVQVAAGDISGDGRDDIVTGTGVGGGPRVEVFDSVDHSVIRNFFAYDASFRDGVNVGTGDIDGDGRDDLLVGAGTGGAPHVRGISGKTNADLGSFFADDSSLRGGVRVDSVDVNNDGKDDFVCHVRIGNEDHLRIFNGADHSFLKTTARVVDDNPSPNDLFERPDTVSVPPTPGLPSYVEGTITAVNAAAGTVTIQLGNGQSVLVTSNSSTDIERNGDHTTLSTFVIGERGEALVGVNGIAWEIEAKTKSTSGGNSGSSGGSKPADNSHVEGTIVALDAAAGTVSIRTQNNTTFQISTNSSTKIQRNGSTTSLSTFKLGDRGDARIGANGLATKLEATGV
ncbi:MAG: FG-GAP-like repeat-containing protein [Gemmataceae bacterium]